MQPFDILIVDDAYPIARALSYLLTRNGYRCRIARSGQEALDEIARERPDLVFLDLQMPGMNGVEVCRRLRAVERNRDLHVIVLTAMGQDYDIAAAMEAGANECLDKPFSPRLILERVSEILSPVELQ
jgi:DNA-binding response OmpR family regulator